jgi:ribosomal protein L11 methyltransferase
LIAHGVVDERDWTEEWKKSYVSFPIGKEFFIIPSWDLSGCPEDRIGIYIDPGQAFGTGTHETTQLTVEALERWVEPHHAVLDLGTGSGILAIAARMLGAGAVFACDIDPVAAEVAKENVERNAEPEVWTMCGSIDAVSDESVDLILGNLTAEVIIEVFDDIHRVLRPNGITILSGILNTQREDIHELLERFGHVIYEEATRGEWLAVVTHKHVA